ncbi:MAG: hypothetical protein RRY96_06230, partial [Ruthenibacterium sp.]
SSSGRLPEGIVVSEEAVLLEEAALLEEAGVLLEEAVLSDDTVLLEEAGGATLELLGGMTVSEADAGALAEAGGAMGVSSACTTGVSGGVPAAILSPSANTGTLLSIMPATSTIAMVRFNFIFFALLNSCLDSFSLYTICT